MLNFREYIEAWKISCFGISHVGWGMNPAARWVSGALYDKRDMQAVEFRALAGIFCGPPVPTNMPAFYTRPF